ncbi:amino acid adenylation domain-containing protein [bacterium]|nr:amino acid adenylation domain-containing protein [bacterium]
MADRKNIQDLYPLTPLQEGMLFEANLDTASSAYFQQMTMWLSGELDPDLFEQAWNELIDRHDILRTAFIQSGGKRPMQVVLRKRPLMLHVKDLTALSDDEARDHVDSVALEQRRRPFDLARDVLLRLHLFRLSGQRWSLLFSFHHILMDGWCFQILFKELRELYTALIEGRSASLPPVEPFGRFVKWLEKLRSEDDLSWWREQLKGIESPTLLPSARGDQSEKGSYRLERHTLTLGEDESLALRSLAARNSVTLSNLVRALWALFLRGHGAEEEVVFGTTLAGRSIDLPGIERMIGLFINTVPVPIRVSRGESFSSLLKRVQEQSFEQDQHQYLSLADIQSVSSLKRDLINHLLIFENLPEEEGDADRSFLPGLDLLDSSTFEQTQYDLEVSVFPRQHLSIRFAYNANRFTANDIHHFSQRFEALARSAISLGDVSLDRIDLVPDEERKWLKGVDEVGSGAKPFKTLTELFAEQVDQRPDETAVIAGENRFSFQQLDQLVDRVAGRLLESGLDAGERVALLLHRSEWLPAGMIGVLKAGGAWVPIDPDYPDARIRTILDQAGVRLALVDDPQEWQDRMGAGLDWVGVHELPEKPSPILPPDDPKSLAYVTFTSGSTGEPKGVMVGRDNLAAFSRNLTDRFGMVPGDIIYAVTTHTFDISILELLCTLLNGVTVVIASRESTSDATHILEEIAEHEATLLQMTPSHLGMILEGLPILPHLHTLLIGGEPLPADLHDELCTLPGKRLFNVYGPTETTIWSTAKEIRRGQQTIGTPLAGERVVVLGWNGFPAPTEVPGEICVGGSGVSRGYIGNPGMTAERFIDDPDKPGETLYRTGDRGRRLQNGEVEFFGRLDNQLKVRGYRIEPGEIEAHIARLEGVLETIVVQIEDGEGSSALVAFYTGLHVYDEATIRRELTPYLPIYMIPSRFIYLDQMPLTHAGKVDRKALVVSDAARRSSIRPFDIPRTELEWTILRIWEEVLNQPRIGIHDSFLEIGGHSLKAMQIVSRLRKDAGVSVSVGELLESGTVAALAERVRLAGWTAYKSIPHLPKSGTSELSHAQRRLYVLEKLAEGGSSAYILPSLTRLQGKLDLTALSEAFRILVQRHESLRTRFVIVDGEPRQEVVEVRDFDVAQVDCRTKPDPEAWALKEAHARLNHPFDLARAPLFDVTLFRLDEEEWLLYTRMHHIITDAGSMAILERELVACYDAFSNGSAPLLPDPEVRYRDFASWQTNLLEDEQGNNHRDYWLKTLRDVSLLDLPADRQRPASQDVSGDTVQVELGEETVRKLVALGQDANVSLFTTMMAVTSLFLKRLTGEEDILLGTPVSGRDHPDLDRVVGFFANTLPLRTRFEGIERFRDLLEHAGRVVRSAMDHALYPFDRLVDDLELQRDLSRPPLVSVMLSLDEVEQEPTLPGVESQHVPLTSTISRFDLTIEALRRDGDLRIGLNYSTALFDRATVERWAQWLQQLLASILDSPERPLSSHAMLSGSELAMLKEKSSGVFKPIDPATNLVSLFEASVDRDNDRSAVRWGGADWTYGKLDSEANRIAHALAELGIEKGNVVASLHDRSAQAVAATLGILKAGGVLLPLRTDDPVERVQGMLRESGCRVVVCEPRYTETASHFQNVRLLTATMWASMPEHRPVGTLDGNDLAYLIFTSGSTGTPKGVLVEHGGFCNMIRDQIERFGVRSEDHVLQFAPLSFDASLSEIFMALLAGAALVPVSSEVIADPQQFTGFLEGESITVATLPPSYLTLLDHQAVARLKVLITAGEAPIQRDAEALREKLRYFNAYGPTESSVCATMQEILPDLDLSRGVPMGSPVANMRLYLLDHDLVPVGPGVPGEIALAGPGLARGYLNHPDVYEKAFLPDPFYTGERMYRTGDLAKRSPDGELIYLGRRDEQLKVRGQRMELGEIRHHLLALPGVRDAALLPFPERGPITGVTGWLAGVEPDQLPAHLHLLKDNLPESMIPGQLIAVETLPLTPQGKLDKKALLAMRGTGAEATVTAAGLRGVLLEEYRRIPGLESIGLDQSFFAAGGNSLGAIQLATCLSERLERPVGVRALFQHPTINSLANHLEQDDEENPLPVHVQSASLHSPKSSLVEVVDTPLYEQFRQGVVAPVDAAAVGYFTQEMLTATGYSHEEFLARAGDKPVLSNIISSPHGRIAFFTLPLFTADLFRAPAHVLDLLSQTLTMAGEMGARMVSLTGLIPSATGYGRDLLERAKNHPEWPDVTTGHATTAATVLLSIERILHETGRSLEDEKLGLLGLGSVGTSMMRLILASMPHPKELLLCDLESKSDHLNKLEQEAKETYQYSGKIEKVISQLEVSDAFYSSSLIVGATSIPDILSVSKLSPGTLVVDDSGPHCFSADDAADRISRTGDVLFTEAGGLRTSTPFGVQAWLPDFLLDWMSQHDIRPYEGFDTHEITGCVLSSLLTEREQKLTRTVGQPSVEECLDHLHALRAWEMTAAPLKFGDIKIGSDEIRRFLRGQQKAGQHVTQSGVHTTS